MESHQLVNWPYFTEEDKAAVAQVLSTGEVYGGFGTNVVHQLEADFVQYMQRHSIDSKPLYAVAFNGCTAAIHAALAYFQPTRQKVIVPAYTFSGTTHPVLYTGAIPLFCDVDPHTGNLDIDHCIELVKSNTMVSGIIVVHMHGIPARLDELLELCRRRGLFLIEDACQAHGARYNDNHVGQFGDFGCFSFSSSKFITGGQGGIAVTTSPEKADFLRSFRSYGEDTSPTQPYRSYRSYIAVREGYNYSMSSIAAALTSSQLKRLDEYADRSRHNAQVIYDLLAASPLAQRVLDIVQPDWTKADPVFHKFRVKFNREAVEYLIELFDISSYYTMILVVEGMKERGISCGLWGVIPVAYYPVYREYSVGQVFPNTTEIYTTSFVLFSEQQPLAVQPEAAVKHNVEKFLDYLGELFND